MDFIMKKILTALFFLTASICFCAENLIVNPNGENEFKGFWKSPRAGIVSENGVIILSGMPESQKDSENFTKLMQVLNRPPEELQNKKMILSFQIRLAKISGSLQIAVREAFGKSALYHGRTFKRYDGGQEWRKISVPFTTRANTSALMFHLNAGYLAPDDRIEIKDLQLSEQ